MVRAIVRRAVLELLRREVVRGGAPGTIIAEWMSPCTRLTLAFVWRKRAKDRGRDVAAAFWQWRIDVLSRRCNALHHGGLCATDVATRAAVQAITQAIERKVW